MKPENSKHTCGECPYHQRSALNLLNAEELRLLDEVRVEMKFSRGQRLFSQGQDNHGAYCIKHGAVKASKSLSSAHEPAIVRITGSGDLLGIRCPDVTRHYTYSADAMSDLTACFLSSAAIEKLSNSVRFARGVACVLSRDLGESERAICNLSSRSLREKIAFLLLELSRNFGVKRESGLQINLKISRKEMARISGTVVESVARVLSEFEREKYIALHGRNIILTDMDKLSKVAGLA